MTPRKIRRAKLRASIALLRPWGALFAVCLLYELPFILRARTPDLTALSLTLEVPLLLTCWALNEATYAARWARVLLLVVTSALIALRLDQWICLALMDEEPLLYDQWFMLRHLAVLISDLMSAKLLLMMGGALLAAIALRMLLRRLLVAARPLFGPTRRRASGRIAALGWGAVLAVSAFDPRLHFMTPRLIGNIGASRAVYASVSAQLAESPYAAYDALRLADRPDVLLFIVESYGRLLTVDAGLRDQHAALIGVLERALAPSGFHAVSAFSTAPVSGGRSWIAEGSMLMGTKIRYEAVFQHVVAARPPSLVGFLNKQGYETVLLAPADRARPGVSHDVNRYGFSRVLAFDDLGYRGPAIGWGIVPDQYSLEQAEQRVLEGRARPVFLDFHMVSSHAPWEDVPSLVARPEPARHGTSAAGAALPLHDGLDALLTGLGRYDRPAEQRYPWMDTLDARMRRGYHETVAYDLSLIVQYLARRRDDALVIVIGDHQPPVIARDDRSFDTPVHVLSRDPRRLAPLERAGFVRGLTIAPDAPPALAHAGLFSLVVHTLTADACPRCAQPLPQGATLLAQ